jgi:hypothetical protein
VPIVAAGAVVWRMRDTRLEVCVIHRPRYDDWTLPKGKVDRGEHVLAAARDVLRGQPGPGERGADRGGAERADHGSAGKVDHGFTSL